MGKMTAWLAGARRLHGRRVASLVLTERVESHGSVERLVEDRARTHVLAHELGLPAGAARNPAGSCIALVSGNLHIAAGLRFLSVCGVTMFAAALRKRGYSRYPPPSSGNTLTVTRWSTMTVTLRTFSDLMSGLMLYAQRVVHQTPSSLSVQKNRPSPRCNAALIFAAAIFNSPSGRTARAASDVDDDDTHWLMVARGRRSGALADACRRRALRRQRHLYVLGVGTIIAC